MGFKCFQIKGPGSENNFAGIILKFLVSVFSEDLWEFHKDSSLQNLQQQLVFSVSLDQLQHSRNGLEITNYVLLGNFVIFEP